MKVRNSLSLISIVAALVLIVLEAQVDYQTYHGIRSTLAESEGDLSPSFVGTGVGTALFYILGGCISLILSIVGVRKKNRFRTFALVLNLATIVYLIVPVGFFLAFA